MFCIVFGAAWLEFAAWLGGRERIWLFALIALAASALFLGDWDIPFIILVIGPHFFPLGRLFKSRQHDATGLALVVLAVVYPIASSGGAKSLMGCAGAGVILWASVLWAMAATSSVETVV